MIIKPLESKNSPQVLIKGIFLVTLVITGILLDKVFLKKNKDIPSILGKTQEIKLKTQEKIVKKVQNNDLIKNSINKIEVIGGAVLGEATNNVNKLTSDSASYVSDVVYKNSIGKVVEQIDKLPKDQQEKIKEQICK